MWVEHVGTARGGLVSEKRRGWKVAVWAARGPGGVLLALGGQKAHFWAEKSAWSPLEATPSGGGGRKKVAGGPCGLGGESFGPFWAAGPVGGRLYWISG